jgi:nucleoid-associated protein YgaU
MGNFEKLSVLVIVVIIVMILVVALYTWTDNPAETTTTTASHDTTNDPVTPPDERGKPGTGWTQEPPQDPPPAQPPAAEQPKPETPVTPPPETPAESKTWIYVVKAGDSLGGIAQKELGAFKRWTEIEALNPGIDSSTLRKGMQITMPPKEAGAAVTPGPTPDKPTADKPQQTAKESPKPGGKYVVRARDTLETIAQRAYGTKSRWPEIYVKNLGRMNNANDLREGMTLFIPE